MIAKNDYYELYTNFRMTIKYVHTINRAQQQNNVMFVGVAIEIS